MTTSSKIYTALIAAQKEIPALAKNARANYGAYLDFDSIIKHVRPILNKHGLLLLQKTSATETGIQVETVIVHGETGEQISSGPLAIPVTNSKGNLAQACGSVITYAKRYSLAAFLGIATGDDNDAQDQKGPSLAELPEEIKSKALSCKTMDEYKIFFSGVSADTRKQLIFSGLHGKIKNTLSKGAKEHE